MNVPFCSGSRTSNKADEGSPRKSWPILSISSSKKSGLDFFAFFIDWIIFPGIDPIYVRRCPRISASSRTPPNEIRTYSRPVAFAIERANDVFPTPGGPNKQIMGPFIFDARLCTAKYSIIRSLTFSRPKCSLFMTFSAKSKLFLILDFLPQGIANNQSR